MPASRSCCGAYRLSSVLGHWGSIEGAVYSTILSRGRADGSNKCGSVSCAVQYKGRQGQNQALPVGLGEPLGVGKECGRAGAEQRAGRAAGAPDKGTHSSSRAQPGTGVPGV